MQKLSILVTGGCGFIGSHLVSALLEHGHRVTVLDNLSNGERESIPIEASLREGDVCIEEDVVAAMHSIDFCFHLAAIASVSQSVDEWKATHDINLGGTINIFEAAKQRGIPVVYASSAAVYGASRQLPLTEGGVTNPLTAYGIDKLACELHAQFAYRAFKFRTIGLRFFNVYGPRQAENSSYSGVISTYIRQIKSRQPLIVYGDGCQTRDFIYIDDVVSALLRCLTLNPKASLISNVCTGMPQSINQLITMLSEITGMVPQVSYQSARIGDIYNSYGDPTFYQRQFYVNKSTDLQTGLIRLLRYG